MTFLIKDGRCRYADYFYTTPNLPGDTNWVTDKFKALSFADKQDALNFSISHLSGASFLEIVEA